MNKTIKAVIFDLDGVLVEAKDWHYQALNKALAVFGCDFSYEEHLSTYDGLPTKMKLEMLNKNKNFPLELSQLVYELKQIYTIRKYIEFSLSNEDVKNPKPDPEIYTKAISMLNLKPSECLIVEDNFNGIKAAKASGAHCLEVKEVEDVNHINIFNYIKIIEQQKS